MSVTEVVKDDDAKMMTIDAEFDVPVERAMEEGIQAGLGQIDAILAEDVAA